MPVRHHGPQTAASTSVSNGGVPEGWAGARLSLLVEINPPKPPASLLPPQTSVTFVPMAAVDEKSGTIERPQARPFSKVRNGYTAFKDGDVILAKITPCMENGKAAVARYLKSGVGFGSTEFHVLRSRGAVLPEYLYHYIRQESFRRAAEAEMTGTVGQKRVPREFLEAVEMPLPPIAEQQRIVELVEKLLSKLGSSRDRLARVPTILERFRQAVLAAAVSGRLTEDWRTRNPDVAPAETALQLKRAACLTDQNRREPRREAPDASALPPIPGTWDWAYLHELGELSRGKSRHRPRNELRLFGGVYPFIQTGDIARSGGRIRSHSQTYNELGLAQSRLWPTSTVCITIAANIAESAVLTYPACFPDSVVGLIVDRAVVIAEYAEYFIRTARRDLAQYAPATAQKNINIEILREVSVPLPPLSEQEEIIARVEDLFRLSDIVERRAVVGGKASESLGQSILAKAFRGELVPTEATLAEEGRPYESAATLLERISAERQADANATSK